MAKTYKVMFKEKGRPKFIKHEKLRGLFGAETTKKRLEEEPKEKEITDVSLVSY